MQKTEFEIITVSSHRPSEWYYCYDEFFKSAQVHGHEVTVLGQNGEYKGLISKPKILKAYLDAKLPRKKNVIFADCWDLLFLRDPSEAFDLWDKKSILFNSELTLFPRGDLLEAFPDGGSPYRFLNSGFFIGEWDQIRDLLTKMKLEEIPDDFRKPDGSMHHENDQEYYLQAYADKLVPMTLDSQCQVCQTLHAVPKEEIELISWDRFKNVRTGSEPPIAHANGGGKDGPIMPTLVQNWKKANL